MKLQVLAPKHQIFKHCKEFGDCRDKRFRVSLRLHVNIKGVYRIKAVAESSVCQKLWVRCNQSQELEVGLDFVNGLSGFCLNP